MLLTALCQFFNKEEDDDNDEHTALGLYMPLYGWPKVTTLSQLPSTKQQWHLLTSTSVSIALNTLISGEQRCL